VFVDGEYNDGEDLNKIDRSLIHLGKDIVYIGEKIQDDAEVIDDIVATDF
jgi:hypothetical protein